MQFHHRAVPIVVAAVMIDSIGFGIVLPVLPRLIVDVGNVTLIEATQIAGWMLFAFAVAQFFAGPVLGALGDRIGRRPVLLFSMLAFAVDYALMALAPTLGWLFAGRFVAGIAGAVYGPANAVLADVTPPERRGATFGLMGAGFGIGFILGPAIGGLLAGFGERAPFVAAAVIAGANALWIFFFLPETLAPDNRRPFALREANIFGAFAPLLRAGGGVGWLLAAAFLWQVAHMVYPATWAFWAKLALGWNEAAIGASLAASGVMMALVQSLVTGKAIARFGEARTVVIGMAVAGAVFAGYAVVRSTGLVYLLIVFAAAQGLVFPSINALLSRMTDATRQGALQGGMSGLSSIALIVGPPLMSQSLALGADHGFAGGNFALAALLTAAALGVIVARVLPRTPRQIATLS